MFRCFLAAFALTFASCNSDKGTTINVVDDSGVTWQMGVKEGDWFKENGKWTCSLNLCSPADAHAINTIQAHMGQ